MVPVTINDVFSSPSPQVKSQVCRVFSAVLLSGRMLDFSSFFFYSAIYLRRPLVTISVQLCASRAVHLGMSLFTNVAHNFSCPANVTRLGSVHRLCEWDPPSTTTFSCILLRFSSIRSARSHGNTRGGGGPTYGFRTKWIHRCVEWSRLRNRP